MRKISLIVIALFIAQGPAGAQGQAPEKALQAAYSAVHESGWSPASAAQPIAIAVPRAVPVGYDGTQAPCPVPRPFAGEWPPSLRCYYGGDGNLHHWAAVHEVRAHIDSFWFEGKSIKEDRIITGYPALLLKQRQYNEWVRATPRFKTTMADDDSHFGQQGPSFERPLGSDYMPTRVPETGRLTPGTLLIPYYKSFHTYREMHETFVAKCSAVEGERGEPGHPCMKWQRVDNPSAIQWVPNYPNADMAEWGLALENLDQARLRLFQRVAALGVFPRKAVWDPLDCFGAGIRRDCSLEALSQTEADAIDGLTREIAAKMLRVREIEDIRASAEPEPTRPAAPVQWIGFAAGRFQMGSDEQWTAKPRHEVTVPAFEMSKMMVTVEQYAECVRAGQCDAPDSESIDSFECNWERPNRELHPVNCVDWNQAQQYARYQGARLPTEAEYEYAAGDGRGLIYPWGDDPPTEDRISSPKHDRRYQNHSAPVCSKPAGNTARGLCDMTGNIRSWTLDRFEYGYVGAPTDGSALEGAHRYPEDHVVEPREKYRGPKGGHLPGWTSLQGTTYPSGPWKSVRGSAVGNDGIVGDSCKNTQRSFAVSVDRFSTVGFRLVRPSR